MEHVLQIAGCLLLVGLVVDRVIQGDTSRPSTPTTDTGHDRWIGAVALLAAATRLEIVFVLLPLCVLLAFHRRWRTMGVMLAASAVPVMVTAAINLGQGWPALPASVLMKSTAIDSTTGLARLLPGLPPSSLVQPRLLAMAALVALLWWWSRRTGQARGTTAADAWALVSIVALAFHCGYVSVPGMLRYEGYLVALMVVSCVVSLRAIRVAGLAGGRGMPRGARLAAGVLAAVAVLGGVLMLPTTALAMREIHSQQLRMAAFVAESCSGCTVVANDIGAMGMYSDARVIDDYGLADKDVLQAKLDGEYDADTLDAWATAHGATMAVVYDDPFWLPAVPERWERLGTWTNDTAVILGGRTVSFFSLDPAATERLRDELRRFRPAPNVEVRIDG